MSVSAQFEQFNKNLWMSQQTVNKIADRYGIITKRLNLDFWNTDSKVSHSLYVGSYGRDTEIHLSDIDILFEMPNSLYLRYLAYTTNGQSALLQTVRDSILTTYPNTKVGGDGQVVVIDFQDGIKFEIVPAFPQNDKSYIYPDSNSGGTWKITNSKPEIAEIKRVNDICNKNLKRLSRMVRAWKDNHNVSMGGLLIDTLAYRFIQDWAYNNMSYLYYDYMSRDFFKWLSEIPTTQTYWRAVGSNQNIYNYTNFQPIARRCYLLALEAIKNHESHNNIMAAKNWRQIYGLQFPKE